ncbi:MAG: YraN family protein [Phycisphaerae bacterium]|nr:YraN family protein [Phycisphaerae bacterium]
MSFGRRNLGKAGEKAARKHLRRHGYSILAGNYVCPAGELDLVCYQDGCIVFVEVKTRGDDTSTDPEGNITCAKRRQLERVARAWLANHREPDCAYRFDAVSVVLPVGGEPRVRHIVDAFVPSR